MRENPRSSITRLLHTKFNGITHAGVTWMTIFFKQYFRWMTILRSDKYHHERNGMLRESDNINIHGKLTFAKVTLRANQVLHAPMPLDVELISILALIGNSAAEQTTTMHEFPDFDQAKWHQAIWYACSHIVPVTKSTQIPSIDAYIDKLHALRRIGNTRRRTAEWVSMSVSIARLHSIETRWIIHLTSQSTKKNRKEEQISNIRYNLTRWWWFFIVHVMRFHSKCGSRQRQVSLLYIVFCRRKHKTIDQQEIWSSIRLSHYLFSGRSWKINSEFIPSTTICSRYMNSWFYRTEFEVNDIAWKGHQKNRYHTSIETVRSTPQSRPVN